MRIKALATAMLFAGAVACDETLTVAPTSEVAEEDAIVDAPSARATTSVGPPAANGTTSVTGLVG